MACGPNSRTFGPDLASPAISSASAPSPTAPTESLFRDPIGVAIDQAGNVWIGDYRRSTLQMFRAEDVAGATGETRLEPALMLSDAGGPNQLTFDGHGNLWVVEWDQDAVASFSPDGLTHGGPAD